MDDTVKLGLSALVPSERERVVAAEPEREGTATLFARDADGCIVRENVPFRPWLLVSGEGLAESVPGAEDRVVLDGDGVLNVRVHFPDQSSYYDACTYLRETTGYSASSPLSPYRVVSDLQQQLLSLLPVRLFRSMTFEELLRLQLDIETLTTPGYDFPNAEREEDAIVIIAMCDSSGWECCLSGRQMDEPEMLREMVRLIQERDPDVLEGHNLFNFDLPFIETRCKRHGVKLALGRDGRLAKGRSSRFTAGDRQSTYRRYDVFGRHVIDTFHLVQLYDVIHRDLDSYGLKSVAKYFGVASEQRTYVEPEDIGELYRRDPDKLCAYSLDDVRETDAVSRVLSPSYFYQAQLVPYSYQNCVTRGNASRIDAMLVAAYLCAGQAIPRPQASRAFRGGLTESLRTGVFKNVWHVDVRSLYPSIIISNELSPRSDSLNVFRTFLAELRRFRLEAKDAAQSAPAAEREHYETLQGSFKVLINSFYGYAGFAQGTFNDYDLAEAVTARGRDILTRMLEFLEGEGALVIEMDTDGIYFVPPGGVTETEVMESRVQAVLPEGIEVDLDTTYEVMLGYKSKNYALLDHDGKVSITGAGLKSRGLEPFQRRYIRELVALLLKGKPDEAQALYERYAVDIHDHKLPLSDFAKRETLSTTPKAYLEKLEAKKTRRSAAYELVLQAAREYKQGDQVSFYVTGDKARVAVADAAKLLADAEPGVRDENVPYYLHKLEQLHRKFAEFVEE